MANLQSSSVRVSWQAVETADRYTVTFRQAQGTDQEGLCPFLSHSASIPIGAPATAGSIAVGLDVVSSVTDMLRAYTTYGITVTAVSDTLGTSDESAQVLHTTVQKGKLNKHTFNLLHTNMCVWHRCPGSSQSFESHCPESN